MMDCIYLVSRYTFYLRVPYLPVRFMDPVCKQGINLEKSAYLGSWLYIYREREHLRY